jgi:formamidopyrimidine-DNA glycosylase
MEWINLCEQIRAVISESLAAKGTTIRDYRDALGESGSFQNFLRVYGRKKDPAGNNVIRETTPDKRTTHWVPEIQK